ncbi:hypothetical protein K438DRAFT_645118 [Mycena galopus ATCC 62051]|nr:hypothetical protein K438DRAFT_645118 [Mycena galopus ATCC 62051]
MTFTTSHIAIIMVHDIFKIIPPFVLRRMGLPLTTMSSVTLPYQAAALLFSTIGLVVSGAFHTAFVFSKSSSVAVHKGVFPPATIQATLDRLGIVLPYRNVDYIRISAEVQWPAIFFALGANVLTLVAWYKFRSAPPAPSVETSVTESVGEEKSAPLGEEEKQPV